MTGTAHGDHGSGSALRRSADPEQMEAVFAELTADLAPVYRRRDLRANGMLYLRGLSPPPDIFARVVVDFFSPTEKVHIKLVNRFKRKARQLRDRNHCRLVLRGVGWVYFTIVLRLIP
ncbi:hypothetical protein [Actinomadura sp. 6N118]|uniref:hypothetical protein n=1 Tax=Actinomadura sp. 6N118 TaxID=3375151 RepID=UPI0037B8A1EE